MATIYGQKTPPPLLKRRKSQPFGRLKPPTTKDNLGLNGRIVVIVWTPRGKARRIISMRKANDREIKKLASNLA